ncbi:MAG: methyltransferase [Candidatus Sericytochromatia bacterium]
MSQTQSSQGHSSVSPEPIFQMVWGPMPAQLLKTAVSLEVFTHIAQGKRQVAELASATGAVPRNLEILLNALAGLKLLQKPTADSYGLTPLAETYLVKGQPAYMGDFTFQVDGLWQPWGQIEQVIRHGVPQQTLQERPDLVENFKKLVPQLFPITFPNAMALAGQLGTGRSWKPKQLLDVAAGSGAWGIAFAKQDPDLRVTAWDFEPVLEITRDFTSRLGVADQFDYLGGDIWQTEPAAGSFDAALLGHICHGYGPDQNLELFRRIHKALVPGGRILIADFIPDENRSSETFPLLFAANMMAVTPEGNTYTLSEYSDWLARTGYSQVEPIEIPPFPGAIVSAVKE